MVVMMLLVLIGKERPILINRKAPVVFVKLVSRGLFYPQSRANLAKIKYLQLFSDRA